MYWMNQFCGFMNLFHYIKVVTISKLMIMEIECFSSVSISALSRCFVPWNFNALNDCKRILNTFIINAKRKRHVSKVALIDIISILTPYIEQPLYPECIFVIRMHGFKFKSIWWQNSKTFIFSHLNFIYSTRIFVRSWALAAEQTLFTLAKIHFRATEGR